MEKCTGRRISNVKDYKLNLKCNIVKGFYIEPAFALQQYFHFFPLSEEIHLPFNFRNAEEKNQSDHSQKKRWKFFPRQKPATTEEIYFSYNNNSFCDIIITEK